MRVMPAGVHHSGIFGGVRYSGGFFKRKRVDIGAESNLFARLGSDKSDGNVFGRFGKSDAERCQM